MMKKNINKKNKGFTLTELIVVIVIIGILAAVLIPSLTGYIKKAKRSNDVQLAGEMNTALQAYCTQNEIQQENLLGTDVKTIVLGNGFDLKPRTKEWTYVYNAEKKLVEVMDVKVIEKKTFKTDNFVDPTNFSEGLYLLGKGENAFEQAVDAACKISFPGEFAAAKELISKNKEYEKIKAINAGDRKEKEKLTFDLMENVLTKLLPFFDPASTLYVSNSTVYTEAVQDATNNASADDAGKTVKKIVYTEGTTNIPLVNEAVVGELSGAAKTFRSAILRSSEGGSELKKAMYPLVADIDPLALKSIEFTLEDISDGNGQSTRVQIVFDELISESISQSFDDVIIKTEILDGGKNEYIVKTTRKFTVSYYNGQGCFARGVVYYSTKATIAKAS